MTTVNKIMWKRGEIAAKEQFLLSSTIFSAYLYFQESNYIFICEMWLFDLSSFLNSANLLCRYTDISKYFREYLGLRDNESRLYVCAPSGDSDQTAHAQSDQNSLGAFWKTKDANFFMRTTETLIRLRGRTG